MLDFYTDWIVREALPRWSVDGFDRRAGRFRERLDGRAAPLAVPHRAMVQARQIYVYAHAALLGWSEAGGALAERAMQSLRRDFVSEAGGQASAAFSVDESGRIVSDVRDAYAHAFILFALAWLYRLNGDRGLLDLAGRLTAFIESELFDPDHGGLFDALPLTDTTKRQNPLMHLLEAYLALERAAPGRGFAERARALVALFRRRLLDARTRRDPGAFRPRLVPPRRSGEGADLRAGPPFRMGVAAPRTCRAHRPTIRASCRARSTRSPPPTASRRRA